MSRTSVYQNHQLETYVWSPDTAAGQEIKALLCVCHGMHEYMGPYERLGNRLKDHGVLTFGIDLVGHGKSEGVRGLIDNFESYVTDVIGLAEEMKSTYPGLPLFLMGHSMGGLIATMIAIKRSDLLSGLLLSAPSLIVSDVGAVKTFLVKVIAAVAPQTNVYTFDDTNITSIPEELEDYLSDPLVTKEPVKAGWCAAILSAQSEYREKLGELKLPLLVIHGTADHVIPLAASEMVYNSASSTDKTLELFVDSYHKILYDKDQEKAKEVISTWILNRLD